VVVHVVADAIPRVVSGAAVAVHGGRLPRDQALPMVKGQWCEIKVVIDLDADEQSVVYNGAPLVTKGWSNGVVPGGAINIAAVDLAGDSSGSEVYYDDISLTRSEGTPCPGDIDEDGDVDTADLLALLAAWGACP
jgi:hypothetical protein